MNGSCTTLEVVGVNGRVAHTDPHFPLKDCHRAPKKQTAPVTAYPVFQRISRVPWSSPLATKPYAQNSATNKHPPLLPQRNIASPLLHAVNPEFCSITNCDRCGGRNADSLQYIETAVACQVIHLGTFPVACPPHRLHLSPKLVTLCPGENDSAGTWW